MLTRSRHWSSRTSGGTILFTLQFIELKSAVGTSNSGARDCYKQAYFSSTGLFKILSTSLCLGNGKSGEMGQAHNIICFEVLGEFTFKFTRNQNVIARTTNVLGDAVNCRSYSARALPFSRVSHFLGRSTCSLFTKIKWIQNANQPRHGQ